MSFVKVSILKKNDNAGRPESFKDKVVLIDVEDILLFPARDAKGVLIATDITLKVGASAIEIYVTPKTLKIGNKSEGEADKKGYIQSLELEHPGDELEYNEFAENCTNKNFVAIVSRWDGTRKRLLGTPGCPLQFSDEGKNDSEAVTNVVKFESLIRGPRIAHYTGEIPVLDTAASGA
ncbi:MAG TPA: hypothetical protein DCL77_14370 [Prolixibacteraceae bacterium]|nr:hypothetical protein [Prolixibacteraceae bacterium]